MEDMPTPDKMELSLLTEGRIRIELTFSRTGDAAMVYREMNERMREGSLTVKWVRRVPS